MPMRSQVNFLIDSANPIGFRMTSFFIENIMRFMFVKRGVFCFIRVMKNLDSYFISSWLGSSDASVSEVRFREIPERIAEMQTAFEIFSTTRLSNKLGMM